MKFLHDKRRAGALALLSALLGAAALFLGASGAQASTSGCNTDGTLGDATFSMPGVVSVYLDETNLGDPNWQGTWVCAAPPDQGAGFGLRDANPSNPYGATVGWSTCGSLTGGGCTGHPAETGAEVGVPTTSTTTSGSTPGGGAGTGTGTCVYVDGTTPAPGLTCPSGVTVGGISIATDDANVSTRTVPGGCVGAAGNPCITTIPSGAAVTVGGGDPTNKTVDGRVLIVGPVEHDVAKTCVANVFTDCTTP